MGRLDDDLGRGESISQQSENLDLPTLGPVQLDLVEGSTLVPPISGGVG